MIAEQSDARRERDKGDVVHINSSILHPQDPSLHHRFASSLVDLSSVEPKMSITSFDYTMYESVKTSLFNK